MRRPWATLDFVAPMCEYGVFSRVDLVNEFACDVWWLVSLDLPLLGHI